MRSLWETNLIAKVYAPHFTEKQRNQIEKMWLRKAVTENHLIDEALIAKLYASYKMYAQSDEERMAAASGSTEREPLRKAAEDGLIEESIRAQLQDILNQPRTIDSMADLDRLYNEMEACCPDQSMLIREAIINQYLDEIQWLQQVDESTRSTEKFNASESSASHCSIIDTFIQSGFDQDILEAYLEFILDPRAVKEECLIRFVLHQLRAVGTVLYDQLHAEVQIEALSKLNLMSLEDKKRALMEMWEEGMLVRYYKNHKGLSSLTPDEFFQQFTFEEFVDFYTPSRSCLFDRPTTKESYDACITTHRRIADFLMHSIQQLGQQENPLSARAYEANRTIDPLIRKYLAKYRSTSVEIPGRGPARRELIECAFRNAANQDNLDDLQALYPYMININAQGPQTGMTALHYTVSFTERTGQPSRCREFLMEQDEIDLDVRDKNGKLAVEFVVAEDTSAMAAEAFLRESRVLERDPQHDGQIQQRIRAAVNSSNHVTPLAMARLLLETQNSLIHIDKIYDQSNKRHSFSHFGHTYRCEVAKKGRVISSRECHVPADDSDLDPWPMIKAQQHKEYVIARIAESGNPQLMAKIIHHLYRPGFVDNLELMEAMNSKLLWEEDVCHELQHLLQCSKHELENALSTLTQEALSNWLTPSAARAVP